MEELQRWEYILQEAHAKAEANPDDTEARDDAQYAADQIRSILSANQSSATPEQTNGQGVSQVITQPIAGAATALGLGGVKGIGHLQNKRDLSMAKAFIKAQQEANAKVPPTGRTGIERQLQGTIDPETGETGRARQTGYNELTHEQKVARAQNKPIIQSLIQSGQITGTNPILGATGYTGSTETGVLAKPEDIAAYKASKAVPTAPQVKPPSMLSNALSTTGNVAGKVLNKISPYAAAYGLGSQAFDTAERGWQGDYPGAVISGIGALSNFGGIPGIVTGLTLEKMNRMRDEFARGERQLPDHEKTDPMGGNYAGGGVVHMAEGRQPSVSLEPLEETGAAFGKFPQMNPKRAQPQGGALHGYLDAFLGAPKNENMSVIIPQEMAYLKAYDKAEPYGMAANMVAPIASVGKTVGTPLVKALGQHAVDKVFSGEPLIKGMDFLNPQVLGAVKFKGGNTPLGLGSTLPLGEQGNMGTFLAKSQITDPMAMFETNLKTHYDPNQFNHKNSKLNQEWKNYLENHMLSADIPSGIVSDINSPEMLKAKREAAELFTKKHNNLGILGGEEDFKRLYAPSSIESIMPHYNSWVNGPLKSHITKTMGTGLETDPMLKLMNESPFEPKELFGGNRDMARDNFTTDLAKDWRKKAEEAFSGSTWGKPVPELQEQVKNSSVGKQTATTPIGKYYEDLIDSTIYPKGTYSFSPKDFPGMQHLKNNAVISDFMGSPDRNTGFDAIKERVMNGLLSGEIPLNKLQNQTPANVLQSIIKEKTDAMKALQKDENAYKSWSQANHDALPTETRFTDVEGRPTNKKLVVFDAKMANENPDLVVRNLSKDTKELNHCVGSCGMDNGKYIPMVNPHTGVANKESGPHGPAYLEKIKSGRLSVASMRGANGESKATLELNTGSDGKLQINQLKGKGNGVVDAETANDLKNWLNHKENTGELAGTPVSDLKNLGDISDLDYKIGSVGNMMDRNKEWNPNTVADLFDNLESSKSPRFFTDKEFEEMARKRGIDLTKEEAKNLENLSLRQLDYMDYFKPGAIRKCYGGYDQIISYDPHTNTVVATAVKRDANGNWVPGRYAGPRTHSTMPDAQEFQREMGRPFRRNP